VRPLADADLVHLFDRMRQYRLLYAVYVLSALMYAASAFALSMRAEPSAYPIADGALILGLAGAVAFFAAYRTLLGPPGFKSRAPQDAARAADHVFFSMLFLLALGESLGMAALAAASFGAAPVWKLGLLCLWQILLSTLITPSRNQWDRFLSLWEECCP
jgi:hypothetical protein